MSGPRVLRHDIPHLSVAHIWSYINFMMRRQEYSYLWPLLCFLLQSVWSSLIFTSCGKVSKTVFRRPSCISSSITSRIICNHNLCHRFINKKRFPRYSQNQNTLDNEEKRRRKCWKHCKKQDKSLVKSGKHMSGNRYRRKKYVVQSLKMLCSIWWSTFRSFFGFFASLSYCVFFGVFEIKILSMTWPKSFVCLRRWENCRQCWFGGQNCCST